MTSPIAAELRTLIAHWEDTLVEFKSYHPKDEPGKREIAQAAVAVANAGLLKREKSGRLVLGVENKTRKVVGIGPGPEDRKEIRDFVGAKSDPMVTILEVRDVPVGDVDESLRSPAAAGVVYILEIEAARYAPSRFYPERKVSGAYGVFPLRDGPSIRECTTEELQKLYFLGAARLATESGEKGPDLAVLKEQLDGLLSGLSKEPRLDIHFTDNQGRETDQITLRPTFYEEKTVNVRKGSALYAPLRAAESMRASPAIKAVMEGLKIGLSRGPAPGPATLPVNFVVTNLGSAPAHDVRAFMVFPKDLKLEEAIEYQSGVTALMGGKVGSGGIWQEPREENSRTARLWIGKLGNGLKSDDFEPLFLTFPNHQATYDVEVTLHADYVSESRKILRIVTEPVIETVDRYDFEE